MHPTLLSMDGEPSITNLCTTRACQAQLMNQDSTVGSELHAPSLRTSVLGVA
jgi:hypothetical protein